MYTVIILDKKHFLLQVSETLRVIISPKSSTSPYFMHKNLWPFLGNAIKVISTQFESSSLGVTPRYNFNFKT